MPKKNTFHSIEAVVDRLVVKPGIRRRMDESVSTAMGLSEGSMLVQFPDSGEEVLFSESAACHSCGISVQELSTHNAQWIQALAAHYDFDPATPY